jgi:hypothetical protein
MYEGVIKCQTKIQKLKFVFQRKKNKNFKKYYNLKNLVLVHFYVIIFKTLLRRKGTMGKLIDLTGQKLGSFTVLKRLPNRNGAVYWEC